MKWLLLLASIMGFLSVAFGAFGAHALKSKLNIQMLSTFEVGVRYLMYHAFAIFFAVWLASPISGWLFFIGTVFFSGSLFFLAVTNLSFFGMFTPIGGLILLSGWLFLAFSIFKLTF